MNRRVLAVVYGAGHVLSLLPVLKRLHADPEVDLTVLGFSLAFEDLEPANIPFYTSTDLLKFFPDEVLEIGKKLSLVSEGFTLPRSATEAYLGLGYWDLKERLSAIEAARLYAEKGRSAFLQLHVAERVLAELAPDLVLATSSPRMEKAFLLASKKVGIPSITLIDHLGMKPEGWVGAENSVDTICVVCDDARQRFLSAGAAPDRVHVTGNPSFDAVFAPESFEAARELQAGWKDKEMVLYACSANEPNNPALASAVAAEITDIARRRDDLQFYVLPHPNQFVLPQFDAPNIKVGERRHKLAPILLAANKVLTLTSTVGIQAALAGTPVVQIELSEFNDGSPYAQLGLAKGVTDLLCLEAALDTAVPSSCEALKPLVSDATDRLSDVVFQKLASPVAAFAGNV